MAKNGFFEQSVQACTNVDGGHYEHFITKLLLGHSRSGAPFWEVFSISVAPYLGTALRLSNITSGGSEARVVRRNTRRKRDNKKFFKNHIISSIITSKDFLSVKIHK